MITSRLRQRRPTKTITVKQKTFAGGQHTESNLLTGLTATYEQIAAFEVVGDGGAVVIVTDVFWFEPASGSLPAIEEKHVLVDGSGNRYEVVAVSNQAGGGNRLKVITRSLR